MSRFQILWQIGMLKLWFQPGYINPPLSSSSSSTPIYSQPLTNQRQPFKMLSKGITACPRCAQDISSSPSGSPGEELWELQEEVRWCFSVRFTVPSDQFVSGMELTKMCLSIPGNLIENVWQCSKMSLTEQIRGQPESDPFTQTGCHIFLSVWFRWLFLFFWQEYNIMISSLIACYISRLFDMLFIWSENEQTDRFNPQLPYTEAGQGKFK